MMHEHNRKSRGFSMVEVLIASVFLSVILLATFGRVTQGVRRAYAAKQMTRATVLAQAILERANVTAAHTLLGAAGTVNHDMVFTYDATVEPPTTTLTTLVSPHLADTTAAQTERTKWITMLNTSDLPVTGMTVTISPLPSGRTFAASAIERIVVEVYWGEVFGDRSRSLRLQTFNVRSAS